MLRSWRDFFPVRRYQTRIGRERRCRCNFPHRELAVITTCAAVLREPLRGENKQEGGVKRGLPDHEAKDLGGEAPTGFDNKSNGIVDDANPPGRSRWIRPP